jgi:hypothetical protein
LRAGLVLGDFTEDVTGLHAHVSMYSVKEHTQVRHAAFKLD